jgi:hypothetical protein
MADDGQVSGSGRLIARPPGGGAGCALLLSWRRPSILVRRLVVQLAAMVAFAGPGVPARPAAKSCGLELEARAGIGPDRRRRMREAKFDPERPFEVAAKNGRYLPESG